MKKNRCLLMVIFLVLTFRVFAVSNKTELYLLSDAVNNPNLSQSQLEDLLLKAERKYAEDLYVFTQVILYKVEVFRDQMLAEEMLALLQDIDESWAKLRYEDLDSDELRMWGDLKSATIRFLPVPKIIKTASESKKLYKDSMDEDSTNASAYISFGTWCYFSPGIAGGGVKKAESNLKRGIAMSSTNADLFTGYKWLSQVYMKKKDDDNYTQAMNKLKNVYGENFFYKDLYDLNQRGKRIEQRED